MSVENKLDLIAKLSATIKNNFSMKKLSFLDSYGHGKALILRSK